MKYNEVRECDYKTEYEMVFFTFDNGLESISKLLSEGWVLYGHPFAVYDATIGGDRIAQALSRFVKVSIDKTAGK